MARTFNDSLQEDLENVFFNTDEFAVTVSIKRKSHITNGVPALLSVAGEKISRANERLLMKVEKIDVRILATRYVINGEPSLPGEGDQIIATLHSGLKIACQALPTSDRPCYDLDSPGMTLLVHTKRLAA